jgi:hypothetical protein
MRMILCVQKFNDFPGAKEAAPAKSVSISDIHASVILTGYCELHIDVQQLASNSLHV